jgi:hypothetical protein
MPTPLTVRFPSNVLDFIRTEAQASGDTAAEYIRVAALARAAFDHARRDPNGNPLREELYDTAARVVAHYEQR